MISIIKDQKSSYVIVIAKDHTVAVENAALELSKYLEKITKAKLPIVTDDVKKQDCEIVVGFAARPGAKADKSLGDEGFTIRVDGKRVLILGSGIRGAIYGVYSFLEKFCDCRFYSDFFERVPEKKDVELPDTVDLTEKPVFEYRNSYWGMAKRPDTIAKLKNNGIMGHDYARTEDDVVIDDFGGGIDYNGSFCHTIAALNEQDDFWNMPCLNDEEVYQRALKNVKKWLIQHPDKQIVSVSQLDGTNGECSCEKCRKVYEEEGSHMGNMLRFCNRIQKDIEGEFPNAIIDTLAYRYTRKPTAKTKPDPRLIIRLCNIECSFNEPLSDAPDAGAQWDPDGEGSFVQNLKKWHDLTDRLYIWDYTTNFSNMSTMFANFHCLLPNARLFAENGVKGVFEQGNYTERNGEFGELRNYLLCKVLWNPYMSEAEYRSHMTDFCNDFYGEGGKYVIDYLDLVHGEALHREYMTIYYDSSAKFLYMNGYKEQVDAELAFYDKGSELFDKAEAAAWGAGDKDSYYRVRASRVQLYNYHFFVLRKLEEMFREAEEKKHDPMLVRSLELIDRLKVESNRQALQIMRENDIRMNREFNTIDFGKVPDLKAYILWW
jgi:hypothetical protein